MPVGLHEAIHGAGTDPNTMNTGAQTTRAVFAAINGLWNS